MLASGTAVIDTFVIYDIAPDDTVYSYEISAVESYKTASKYRQRLRNESPEASQGIRMEMSIVRQQKHRKTHW